MDCRLTVTPWAFDPAPNPPPAKAWGPHPLRRALPPPRRAHDPPKEAAPNYKVNTNLMVTLLACGLECEQICSIFDTGATKPFVQSIRQFIHGILVSLPESSKVTIATTVSSAASMSLRRYNFAMTKDMVDTAKRIARDISRVDVITVLAAPLVCPNFQNGFDISSGNVFKDLRIIPEF